MLPTIIQEFLLKVAAAAGASLLVSLILSARFTEHKWNRRHALIYSGRQLGIAIISGVIAAGIPGVDEVPLAFLAGLMFPLLWNLLLSPIRDRIELDRVRTSELKQTLVSAQAANQKEPERPKTSWDRSRASLELYIQKNQSQISSIYFITVLVMMLGFSLIIFGVWRAIEGQLGAATIAALAGVVTQAIGASLLIVYKSIVSQAGSYAEMLERINTVGMAVQIVDTIPDAKQDLKNKARTKLVTDILALPQIKRKAK